MGKNKTNSGKEYSDIKIPLNEADKIDTNFFYSDANFLFSNLINFNLENYEPQYNNVLEKEDTFESSIKKSKNLNNCTDYKSENKNLYAFNGDLKLVDKIPKKEIHSNLIHDNVTEFLNKNKLKQLSDVELFKQLNVRMIKYRLN